MEFYPVYILVVSYGKSEYTRSVIDDFFQSKKPVTDTKLLIIENGPQPELKTIVKSKFYKEVVYHYLNTPIKAKAINFAIRNCIPEDEAFIICIDNDIRFKADFIIKYFEAALEHGNNYYFGSSFSVTLPEIDPNLIPYLQGSQQGKTDREFEKMTKRMFLGFSYAFFKSQWRRVNGLDERFSPGSKYGLAAEESVFQKKLQHAGFKPSFVPNNEVEHRPLPNSYSLSAILDRQENNGYTHGFQDLIQNKSGLQIIYFKKLFYLLKRSTVLFFKTDKISHKVKVAYLIGYFKALPLFLKTSEKHDFLKF